MEGDGVQGYFLQEVASEGARWEQNASEHYYIVLSVAEAHSAGKGGSVIMAPQDAGPTASSSQLLITPFPLPYTCAHLAGTEECPTLLPPGCPEAAGPRVCPGAATVRTHLHVPLLPHH